MGNLQEPVVISSEDELVSPSQIGAQRWALAEKATQNIISKFQPTVVSHRRRIQVINYVRRLIRNFTGCEVVPYGSVPLKTYLPDGDIDMTAFGSASAEEVLANDIVSELQREEKNSGSEFAVKEIRLIHAEVKLVKCLVQNIVVDISFNQIGGLCTVCFLEQVDRFIGKDHLFKRSILLIKAWCYYESRILGAHHGLISTYGLETLVLYIFQVFHSTLDGPLAVLYRFLDYFSNFDWKNYCITLRGPVRLSSLPEFETENTHGDMLLTEDFYRYCVETFSVPLKGVEMHTRIFPQKHLNIVDPLKEFNNLGRSVSEGNFYRIKSAFAYGARKLGQILMRSGDNIAVELHSFFSNTLDRHGSGHRPDIQDSMHMIGPGLTHPVIPVLEIESNPEDEDGVCIIKADAEMSFTTNRQQLGSTHSLADANGFAGSGVLECHFAESAENHASPRIQGLQIQNTSERDSNTCEERSDFQEGKIRYAPHLYFSKPPSGYGESENGKSTTTQLEDHENQASQVLQEPYEQKSTKIGYDLGSEVQGPVISADVPSIPYRVASPYSAWDLLGDFNTHLNCLQYGRWFHEFGMSMPPLSVPPPPPYFQSLNSRDAIQLSSTRNGFSNGSINGFVHGPVFYPINPMIVPGASYDLEDVPKTRGTGTYFPNMHRPPHGYRPSSVKGKIEAPARSPRRNGRITSSIEFPVDQRVAVGGYSDGHNSGSPRRNINGSTLPPIRVVESGPFLHIPPGTPLQESNRQPRHALVPQSAVSETESPKAVVGPDENRSTIPSSYHLKDNDDFPPLSS